MTSVSSSFKGNTRTLIHTLLATGLMFGMVATASAGWTNGQAATSVLGQSLFTTSTQNNGGIGPSSLNGPTNICVDNTNAKVYVMDYGNHRVLRYSVANAITTFGAAEVVLGQPDFVTNTAAVSAVKMSNPESCAISASGTLFVADSPSRVLRFDNAHLKTSGAAADGVLGAPDFVSIGAAGPTNATFGGNFIYGLALSSGGALFVPDRTANRILRFDNAAAKANGAAADGVLGRPDFVTGGAGSTTASTLNTPFGLAIDASNNLYVADSTNRRVLRYNNAPAKANGAAADGVLGAADFTTAGAGAASASNFGSAIYSVGIGGDGNLYVGDFNNQRMMIFNSPASKANGASADNVLGQPNFTTTGTNLTATGLGGNLGLGFTTLGYFLIGDYGNNRVMVYTNAQLSGQPQTPVCTLTASPAAIVSGGSTTLSASCNPASTHNIWTNNSFPMTSNGGTVSPSETTTYSMAGVNANGTGTSVSVTVTVRPQSDARNYFPAASIGAGYISFLRVINKGSTITPISVSLIDETTGVVSASVQLLGALAPGASTFISTAQIEAALGVSLSANARPRIRITGNSASLDVQSLLRQPNGAYIDISTGKSGSSITVDTYVPAAAASTGYVTSLRIANTGTSTSAVTVAKIDPITGVTGAAATLHSALPAGAAVAYSATQIEAALGVSIPSSERPRLLISAPNSTLDLQSYLQQPDGVMTETSTGQSGTAIDVRLYVPAAEANYTTFLRVINKGSSASPVTATFYDALTGQSVVSGTLIASLPAQAVMTLSSAQIETALGWKITPASSRPRLRLSSPSGTASLALQSFLLQPNGAYSEVSNALSGTTVDVRTYVPAAYAASGVSSYLRINNTGATATSVSVALIDPTTGVVSNTTVLNNNLAGGTGQTFSAAQLETAMGIALPADFRPRLRITAGNVLDVQSYLLQAGTMFTEVSGGE